ncbi:PREDICTED: CMRF35-like molecule 1 [Galeopterus variegatus]|uniref:CMRF35-like molecule 1 n=1 Tax=Galeopterus variegatus TaxID=482537 RepID=A0ABM0RH10_GALVR|nr:PREDICTED: CMRF35-like molecule 1 [Galeopterus variegatus]
MDLCFPVISAAKDAITSPEAVSGVERGSLTVQCHYDGQWETHRKWWCRGAIWKSCKTLVKTAGSEQMVKMDHVSIRDDQKNHTFTVTMEDLRIDDADTYWCGIERTGIDLGVKVKVTIDPATVTQEETEGFSTLTRHYPRSGHMKLSILIPLTFAVLLLLLVVASLLAWRMLKRQKKAAGISPEQPLESDLCYANLTLQQTGRSPGPSQKKVPTEPSSSAQAGQAEVEYVSMASFPGEEVPYVSLSLDNLDQEPTYSNTSHLINYTPGRDHEEPTEYSAIRRL